jgi:hypothetical protein
MVILVNMKFKENFSVKLLANMMILRSNLSALQLKYADGKIKGALAGATRTAAGSAVRYTDWHHKIRLASHLRGPLSHTFQQWDWLS